ncbi:MAG: hypothetical protein RBT34_03190 [Anaerolineaceae bacterium]|jgi:hypothetical protein|nr:hypothetical protein [Anaerolineaceae bacterium]
MIDKNNPTNSNRVKWYSRWVAGFAIITIPIFTLLFALKQSPFQYTLSQIGNFFDWDHRLDFIIWGIVTGACFMIYIGHLFRRVNFKNKRAIRWLVLANVFLVLTVLTPSIKEVFPISTRLHFLYSGLFALSLVLTTSFFVQYLGEIDEKISAWSLKWGQIIVGGSVLSLFIFGKTGIFELFFLLSFTIYLIVLSSWLRKDEFIAALQEYFNLHFKHRKHENDKP